MDFSRLLCFVPGDLKANNTDVHLNPITNSDDGEDFHNDKNDLDDHSARDGSTSAEETAKEDFSHLTGRQKKLFELRLKMVRTSNDNSGLY